ALRALEISAAGLARRDRRNEQDQDERHCPDPLIEFAQANETPAERQPAPYHGEGGGGTDRAVRELAYCAAALGAAPGTRSAPSRGAWRGLACSGRLAALLVLVLLVLARFRALALALLLVLLPGGLLALAVLVVLVGAGWHVVSPR